MRLVILADKTGWHVTDLLRAAAARGHDTNVVAWRALRGTVDVDGASVFAGQTTLTDADALIARTMPAGSLEQIVFRMDALHRLQCAGVTVINPPRAIETAVDKYLALWRMAERGLRVPPTVACQSPAEALTAFEDFERDVVLKPIFGSEGFGMIRLTERAAAERVFHAISRMGSILYVQKFIAFKRDIRLFVIDGEVVATMDRVGEHWPANVARGGAARVCTVDESIHDMAARAAAACEALVVGVDVLLDHTGRAYVLEVNAAPGWRALSTVTNVDIASRIITFAESRIAAVCHA